MHAARPWPLGHTKAHGPRILRRWPAAIGLLLLDALSPAGRSRVSLFLCRKIARSHGIRLCPDSTARTSPVPREASPRRPTTSRTALLGRPFHDSAGIQPLGTNDVVCDLAGCSRCQDQRLTHLNSLRASLGRRWQPSSATVSPLATVGGLRSSSVLGASGTPARLLFFLCSTYFSFPVPPFSRLTTLDLTRVIVVS